MSKLFLTLFSVSVCLLSLMTRPAQGADDIPDEIADEYASTAHADISDDFNGDAVDRKKWAYRMRPNGTKDWGDDERYISIENDGSTRYVAIRGNWEERKGSGLGSLHMAQFGFYTSRWRTDGIIIEKMTPWHPSIWLAAENVASGKEYRKIPKSKRRLEIDFMEYWHQPLWQVQTVGWGKGGNLGMQKMRKAAPDFPTRETGWITQGLEYTPEYVQSWEVQEGKWVRIGEPVPFVDGDTNEHQLNKEHAQPGYWILSNKFHWQVVKKVYDDKPKLSDFLFADSSLDVDYFRYYPRVAED